MSVVPASCPPGSYIEVERESRRLWVVSTYTRISQTKVRKQIICGVTSEGYAIICAQPYLAVGFRLRENGGRP